MSWPNTVLAGGTGWTCANCGAWVEQSQTHDCKTMGGPANFQYLANKDPSNQIADDVASIVRLLKEIEFLLRVKLHG